MKKIILICITLCVVSFNLYSQENIRKIATWNMKWLGTNSGNQLDAIENVELYADYILKTEATLFALQEIGATHSFAGKPKCFYLDKIVKKLNESISNDPDKWEYILDDQNKQQRLAFLFKKDLWELSDPKNFRPGSSFNYIRRPFIVSVEAKETNAELKFDYINIHLKAFHDPEDRVTRTNNFNELAAWLETNDLDDDVLIAGDTNVYSGETDSYQSMININYKYVYDGEKTTIYAELLGESFDKFFSSPGLYNEIQSAKNIIGNLDFVDVIKDNDHDEIVWFYQNLSDHFPVVLNIDVSREQ